tara:strand:- start:2820 stop:3002 length:183 start_codon:yes stop_codon:yes gene_type:complete
MIYYDIWGRPKQDNNYKREELLDRANSKEEAENKTKVLRNIQYFRKWSLWIEQSFTVHLH